MKPITLPDDNSPVKPLFNKYPPHEDLKEYTKPDEDDILISKSIHQTS